MNLNHLPELKVRVVNVVDLMTLYSPDVHPHGIDDGTFTELFTAEKPVVFSFHGYQRAIHELIHGHPNAARFHVRGFNEQGTTTTPFDMVVLLARWEEAYEEVWLIVTHVARRTAKKHSRPRMLSCFARGIVTIIGRLIEVMGWLWAASCRSRGQRGPRFLKRRVPGP